MVGVGGLMMIRYGKDGYVVNIIKSEDGCKRHWGFGWKWECISVSLR